MTFREEVLLGAIGAIIALLLIFSVPWVNRNAMPTTWAGTAIVGGTKWSGTPAEMPGIEIGFRHDGVVIWRQKGKK